MEVFDFEKEKEERGIFDWREVFERNKYSILFLLTGLFLVAAGILGFKFITLEDSPKVEILNEEDSFLENKEENEKKILAEIAGAVLNPGVYELDFGSRVSDLITAAGGFSAQADRDWVSKNINQAQKLADGGKVYIPKISDSAKLPNSSDKINLNTASASELESLWGIGEATAKKIIESRPYQKTEEILEKKIIKSNVWEKIKDQITVF